MVVADEHVLTADSLFSIISQGRSECELVAHASTVAETVSTCARLKPDLLLLGVSISFSRNAQLCSTPDGIEGICS